MNAPASLPRLPTVTDVEAAARRIAGVAVRTPLLSFPVLDEACGGRIFLKPEIFQRTGSFKFRGAYNRLSQIAPDKRAAGVVAWSSGNHAQGVAAAAKLLGMPAIIVMPADAPKAKLDRTAALGATVRTYDRVSEDREAIGRALAAERGAVVVPPYDDPDIIAGQGTAGLEIAEDLAQLGAVPDAVLACASGGGLAAGVALAVKARFPACRVLTAEPAGFDDHARSFVAGKRVRNPSLSGSFCDALLAAEPGEITFAINRDLAGAGVVVSDAEVADAIRFAVRELKLVVEPGGAVALAALLSRRHDARGQTAVALLSGGNIDAALLARLIAG